MAKGKKAKAKARAKTGGAKRGPSGKGASRAKPAAPKKKAKAPKRAPKRTAKAPRRAPKRTAKPKRKAVPATVPVPATVTRSRTTARTVPGTPAAKRTRPRERLGAVAAPSGRVVVFDVGLLGSLGRAEIAALQVALDGLPTDRPLEVTARRLGAGRFGECWADVTLEIAPGAEVARSRELGRAPVDYARLMIIDAAALDAWKHEEPMDGRADFVWWGRDAAALAEATGAPAQTEGYGWIDLPVAECVALGQHAEGLKAKHGWLLRTDYRPHSHHYVALAQIRSTPTESGTVDVGGGKACVFSTTWGDGVFPVHLDLDARGAPVALRIELATEEALANMESVN